MCLVSKPSIPAPSAAEQAKPLPIIRNPILDGLVGNIAALRAGTNAFRIDLANPLTIPTSRVTPSTPATAPADSVGSAPSPSGGGGFARSGGGSRFNTGAN